MNVKKGWLCLGFATASKKWIVFAQRHRRFTPSNLGMTVATIISSQKTPALQLPLRHSLKLWALFTGAHY